MAQQIAIYMDWLEDAPTTAITREMARLSDDAVFECLALVELASRSVLL